MTLSLGSVNLLQQLTELRETFFLIRLLVYFERVYLRNSEIEKVDRSRFGEQAWSFHTLCAILPKSPLDRQLESWNPIVLGFYGGIVTEQAGGWFTINYYRKDPPFLSLEVPPPHAHLLGSKCPPPEERRLSMPETGEKERNCLFKSYTNLE